MRILIPLDLFANFVQINKLDPLGHLGIRVVFVELAEARPGANHLLPAVHFQIRCLIGRSSELRILLGIVRDVDDLTGLL